MWKCTSGSTPGLGRSPINESSLQYSCQDKPMGREAWRITVQAVTKSRICPKQLNMFTCTSFEGPSFNPLHGYLVSFGNCSVLQLWHQSSHKQYVHKWMWLCPNKILWTVIVWSISHSLLTPDGSAKELEGNKQRQLINSGGNSNGWH